MGRERRKELANGLQARGLVTYLRAGPEMSHRLDAPATLAFVKPSASGIVSPGVHCEFVFGSHHTFLTVANLRQLRLLFREVHHIYSAALMKLAMVDLVLLGLIVIIAGFVIIFLTTIFASRPDESDADRKPQVRGGGVVMIGPIPIIFGSDMKWTVVAIVLAIMLIVLSLVLTRS